MDCMASTSKELLGIIILSFPYIKFFRVCRSACLYCKLWNPNHFQAAACLDPRAAVTVPEHGSPLKGKDPPWRD